MRGRLPAAPSPHNPAAGRVRQCGGTPYIAPMPFDTPPAAAQSRLRPRTVAWWLLSVAGLVWIMVAIGGPRG